MTIQSMVEDAYNTAKDEATQHKLAAILQGLANGNL